LYQDWTVREAIEVRAVGKSKRRICGEQWSWFKDEMGSHLFVDLMYHPVHR
jgi:hypothetical protein